MAETCSHLHTIKVVAPGTLGCAECLETGSWWVHLRVCRICGHVGCCDDSPNKHAGKHFRATGHPIMECYDPPDPWGWCYIDEVTLDFSRDKTAQIGPLPRFVLFGAPRQHRRFRH
jgi:Zn-finger in ubiquitin-hydrolases and other protein